MQPGHSITRKSQKMSGGYGHLAQSLLTDMKNTRFKSLEVALQATAATQAEHQLKSETKIVLFVSFMLLQGEDPDRYRRRGLPSFRPEANRSLSPTNPGWVRS